MGLSDKKKSRRANFTVHPRQSWDKNEGFSILEVLISVGILSIILTLLITLMYQMNYMNFKTRTNDDALEAAKKIMETISYEIRGAKSIYTPTSSPNQISLETSRYLQEGETSSFIDFFICGSAVCVKKESQNPVPLTADNVETEKLEFLYIVNGPASSVKINIIIKKKNPTNDPQNYSSANLASTVLLRNY